MAAPAHRQQAHDTGALSSDDEMPALLPTSARRNRPTYVHPESDDSEVESMPGLVPVSATPRQRPTSSGMSDESSDGSLPDLVPVSSSMTRAGSRSAPRPQIPPPQTRTRSAAAASAAAAAIARASHQPSAVHRLPSGADSNSDDEDGPPPLIRLDRSGRAPVQRERGPAPGAASVADWEVDSDSDEMPVLMPMRPRRA